MIKKSISFILPLLIFFLILNGCQNEIDYSDEKGKLLIKLSRNDIKKTNNLSPQNDSDLPRTKNKVLKLLTGYRIRVINKSTNLKVFKDVVFDDKDTIIVNLSLPAKSGYTITALGMIGGKDTDGDGKINDYYPIVGGTGEATGVTINNDTTNTISIQMYPVKFDISQHPNEVSTGEVYNIITPINGLSESINDFIGASLYKKYNSKNIDYHDNRKYGSFDNNKIIIKNITAPIEPNIMYYGIKNGLDGFEYSSNKAIYRIRPEIVYPLPQLNEEPLQINITDTNSSSIDIDFKW